MANYNDRCALCDEPCCDIKLYIKCVCSPYMKMGYICLYCVEDISKYKGIYCVRCNGACTTNRTLEIEYESEQYHLGYICSTCDNL